MTCPQPARWGICAEAPDAQDIPATCTAWFPMARRTRHLALSARSTRANQRDLLTATLNAALPGDTQVRHREVAEAARCRSRRVPVCRSMLRPRLFRRIGRMTRPLAACSDGPPDRREAAGPGRPW